MTNKPKELPQPDINKFAAAVNKWLVPAAMNQPKKPASKREGA